MKIIKLKILPLLLLLAACSAPYPENNLVGSEKDVYITNYDNTVDFRSYKTFMITDSVISISSNDEEKGKVLSAGDKLMLQEIAAEMIRNGYTEVKDTSVKPDVAIVVTKIRSTYTGTEYYNNYNYYNYGYGYYNYYDPFYWGYPGYNYYYPNYYYAYTYTITNGSIGIDMLDLKNAVSSNSIKIIWSGMIISKNSNPSNDRNRVSEGIRGLFKQSQYLNNNK